MATFAILLKEPFPSTESVVWAAFAGVMGALGVAALYHAISQGYTALAAPTSGVIGAIIPVIFSILTVGFPNPTQIIGFLSARKRGVFPNAMQMFGEIFVSQFYGLVEDALDKKMAKTYGPLICALFMFLVLANWLGMRQPTSIMEPLVGQIM